MLTQSCPTLCGPIDFSLPGSSVYGTFQAQILEWEKRIVAIHIESGKTIEFDSITAARKAIGTSHIQEVLKGLRYEAKGYTFRYVKEVMPDADIDNKSA